MSKLRDKMSNNSAQGFRFLLSCFSSTDFKIICLPLRVPVQLKVNIKTIYCKRSHGVQGQVDVIESDVAQYLSKSFPGESEVK